jgi:hypothetical protein
MNATLRFLPLIAACALPAFAAIAPPTGLGRGMAAPAGVEPAFALSAEGVQVYQCSALGADGWGWTYVAPDVTLYEGTRTIATHKVPDLWEASTDRSSVTAVPRVNQAAGGRNLPWQLLRAAPLNETGMFAGVTHVQRVNTEGGLPEATGCGPANVGAENRVAFRADYYFYRAAGAG